MSVHIDFLNEFLSNPMLIRYMRCASRKCQSKSLLKVYSQSVESTTVYV